MITSTTLASNAPNARAIGLPERECQNREDCQLGPTKNGNLGNVRPTASKRRCRRSAGRSAISRQLALFAVLAAFAAGLTSAACAKTTGAGAQTSDALAPRPHPHVTFHAPPKALPTGAVTHDWNAFLGPTHDGVCAETKLLEQWPAGGPRVVWEMKTGTGYAGPAVAGERLVFFHRIGDEEIVECLHAESGKRYWRFRYPSRYSDRFDFNNGPRCSPVIDGELVFTHGAEGKLHCLDLKTGRVIWKRDTAAEFNVPQNFFGVGPTPLVEGELLIVVVGAPAGPTVAAFDKRTGKLVWKSGKTWTAGYGSPTPAVVYGKRRIFVFTGGDSRPPVGGLLSVDPADGSISHRFAFRGETYLSVNASSPVVVGNQVFISSSYRTGGVLLDLLADGGVKEAWKTRELETHFMTPIHRDGYLYGINGSGSGGANLVCLELKSGKTMWQSSPLFEETLQRDGQKRTVSFGVGLGSLIWADGAFLCLTENGHLLRLDLSPKGARVLQKSWLFPGSQTWTPPAISRGLLYICQNTKPLTGPGTPRLICYDLRAAQ